MSRWTGRLPKPRRLSMPWFRRLSTVRARTTVGATAVAAAALIVGGIALVLLVRGALTDNVEVAADLRAEDVVALLEGGVPPDRIAIDSDEDSLVQILDGTGTVEAASGPLPDRRAIARLRPGQSGTIELPGTGQIDRYRVVALGTSDGEYLVLVARSLEPVRESTAVLSNALLVGVPRSSP